MDSDTFINNLLGEMVDRIVNGKSALPAGDQAKLKESVPFQSANFFTWCTPGIPVEPADFAFLKGLRKPVDPEQWKDLSDAEKSQRRGDESYALTVAMDNFSVLVDTVPNKSGMVDSLQVWEPQNRISHIYESALRFSEVADTPASPDAQARIDKIREALVETVQKTDADTNETFTEQRPSKMVMAYNKYAAEYLAALSGYIDLMGKATDGSAADVQRASMLGPAAYQQVTAAYDAWESQGFKTKYERMVANLAQLEGVSMTLLLKEYQEIFRRSQRTSLLDGSDYNVSRLVPGAFYESGGWTQYSFSTSELQSVDLTKTQKYRGAANYGLIFGGSGGHARENHSSTVSFDNTTIRFELTQVPIVRAWFREDFLTSTKWRFKAGDGSGTVNPGDLLSNGDATHPEGKLFAYPTVVLFARNISISKSTYDKLATEAQQSTSGRAGFSLGPFAIGGSGSYHTTERKLEVKQTNDMITVPGMQIIGFRNHILPKSPNPDPAVSAWV